MHDELMKCILPLAEFISTAHDQVSISRYLTSIKSKLEVNRIKLAKFLVVDMSWALINAVLLSFNNCNLPNYINWCYYMIFKTKEKDLTRVMKTRIFLCSTHFLKNIIKHSKKIDCTTAIRKTFIFMFSLVQNALTINEIEYYLINIHNVFNSKYFDPTVAFSLKCLGDYIKKRNLNNLETDDTYSKDEANRNLEFSLFVKETNIFISVDFEFEVKKCSPFKTYFDKKVVNYNQMIKKKESETSVDTYILNEFFCPELFDLLNDYLYILPLWTGLLINPETISYITKTRLTNNPVENWFNQVKNHILTKKKVSTTEIVGSFYKNVLAKYYKFYSNNNKDSKLNNKSMQMFYETWNKNQKNKREKGYYFKPNDIFKFKTIYDYNFINSIENLDFKRVFENKCSSTASDPQTLHDNKNNKTGTNKLAPSSLENLAEFFANEFQEKIHNKTYAEIKSHFDNNQDLFKKIIREIREIKEYTTYKNQIVYTYFKNRLNLDKFLFPVESSSDGSCLYHSISIILFRDELFSIIIKLSSIYNFFQKILKKYHYELEFKTFLENTCKINEWANELNIVSLSILLNRTIFCYNPTKDKTINVRVKFCVNESSDKPILIGLCNNHFFPILDLNDNYESFYPIKESNFLRNFPKILINK